MIVVSASYTPLFEDGKKGNFCDFFVRLSYRMFPEMEGEFDPKDWNKYKEIDIPMGLDDKRDLDSDIKTYKFNLELPFGDVKIDFFYTNKKFPS